MLQKAERKFSKKQKKKWGKIGTNEQKWAKMDKNGQKNIFLIKYLDMFHQVEHLFLNFWSKLVICCIKQIDFCCKKVRSHCIIVINRPRPFIILIWGICNMTPRILTCRMTILIPFRCKT